MNTDAILRSVRVAIGQPVVRWLLGGLFASGRLRWKWIWVHAAVYVACGVPQMLAGRSVWHVVAHWARVRVEMTPGLSLEILRDGSLVRKRLQLTVFVTLHVVLVWRFVNFRWAG